MKRFFRLMALVMVLVFMCGVMSAAAAVAQEENDGTEVLGTRGSRQYRSADEEDDQQRRAENEAEFSYDDYQFIDQRQQFVVVGVDDRGNAVFAGNSEEFGQLNYVVIDENQREIEQQGYIEEATRLAEDRGVADELMQMLPDSMLPDSLRNPDGSDRENIPGTIQLPNPTEVPAPSVIPTAAPTEMPAPSVIPTETPAPSAAPTEAPAPSVIPTAAPTEMPAPSVIPTAAPTEMPAPSVIPTEAPRPSIAPDYSNCQTVIDITDYITAGRFDFTQFEETDKLVNKQPEIKKTEAKESDPVMNVYFEQEALQADEETVVEPGRADYYIDIEVGRIAHLFPTYAAMNTFTVEDKTIMGEPYRYAEPGFVTNYRAHAYRPGDTTITCTHETSHVVDFVEVWHVHVYCRDISFERDQYVVEKSGKSNQYLTLQLGEFEYTIDQAYDFTWSSSNTEVATLASGWKGTRCYACVKKAGVTTITVKDIYGNTRSTLLVVKPDAKTISANLTADVKAASLTAKTKGTASLVKVSWTVDSDTTLDGYQIYVSTDGKNYTKLKTVTSGTTYSYSHKKAEKGVKYYYKVRGYKKIDGKNVYTPYAKVVTGKRK